MQMFHTLYLAHVESVFPVEQHSFESIRLSNRRVHFSCRIVSVRFISSSEALMHARGKVKPFIDEKTP